MFKNTPLLFRGLVLFLWKKRPKFTCTVRRAYALKIVDFCVVA